MSKLILLILALLVLHAAAQAPIPPVLDWKAPATLPTYLLQHRPCAPGPCKCARPSK